VRVASQAANPNAELALQLVHMEAAEATSALGETLEDFGARARDEGSDPATLYRSEHSFLQSHTVIPLLYLPRAYGVNVRVQNLVLAPDGTPLLANVSLEDAK